ncbi:MAG: hypothetical protein WKG07_23755 [Hymenobacter sp.]
MQGYRQLTPKQDSRAVRRSEYNFLDYHRRPTSTGRFFPPYSFAGWRSIAFNTSRCRSATTRLCGPTSTGRVVKLGIAVPGRRVKYALTGHFNLGAEMGVRKTLHGPARPHRATKTPLLVSSHDQDWYYYSGR